MTVYAGITVRGRSGQLSMPEISVIERACDRAAKALDHAMSDEIALLRLARLLKAVNRDLILLLQWSAAGMRGIGAGSRAEPSLRSMEMHLRHILLDHATLTLQQMHAHLNEAICEAFDVLELLQTKDAG
jgi:hypothetical protein